MSFCLNCQLSSAIKDRENSWRKQKSEIEEHYSNLIKDLHTRTQVQYTVLFLCLTSRQELVCSCARGWRRSNKNHVPKPITISSNFKFFSNCFLSFLVFSAVLLTGFCVSCDLLEYWVSLSWVSLVERKPFYVKYFVSVFVCHRKPSRWPTKPGKEHRKQGKLRIH